MNVRTDVFSAAENDATFGAAVTKSGKAFHARVAASSATGKERSPNVSRRVIGTTSVDDEDDGRRRRDWTSVTR